MNDGVTWVVLGDGTYVKILVDEGSGSRLMPLRSGDFEHTSKLTYEMVTSHKQSAEKHSYYEMLAEFLSLQQQENSYQHLVLAAPAEVLGELKKALPNQVTAMITGELAQDLLAKPDHHIQEVIYSQAGVGPR